LLSSRGISTPSLQARGEQRRFFYFNNDRDIPRSQTHYALFGKPLFSLQGFAADYGMVLELALLVLNLRDKPK
jgi:hypothetical protein